MYRTASKKSTDRKVTKAMQEVKTISQSNLLDFGRFINDAYEKTGSTDAVEKNEEVMLRGSKKNSSKANFCLHSNPEEAVTEKYIAKLTNIFNNMVNLEVSDCLGTGQHFVVYANLICRR
ncbi:unnamed protein product [Acanthoscelides obtectus]|uniref:Uncharacterized protein n=1 Tax=Acanthoscelides obtectus TaxID=200917 RepID=A0A9P0PMV7_ACAOB|nr:unnamed protein product [Acanthoscelides obtectus]CAK1648824.1 hypothetical protein AOBTE_LOCUS15905 [Acanthoscelides obtectus]